MEEVKVKQAQSLEEAEAEAFHKHFINISGSNDLEGDQALQLTMLGGLALLQNCKVSNIYIFGIWD